MMGPEKMFVLLAVCLLSLAALNNAGESDEKDDCSHIELLGIHPAIDAIPIDQWDRERRAAESLCIICCKEKKYADHYLDGRFCSCGDYEVDIRKGIPDPPEPETPAIAYE